MKLSTGTASAQLVPLYPILYMVHSWAAYKVISCSNFAKQPTEATTFTYDSISWEKEGKALVVQGCEVGQTLPYSHVTTDTKK